MPLDAQLRCGLHFSPEEPPAGYAREAEGTVVHTESGQTFSPARDADGNVRSDGKGNPIFNTTSGGTTAQTTLTRPSTSGETVFAPSLNRIPLPDDLPTNIHIGQQGKHIRGHNNFQEGRSYFNEGVDPAELLAGVHSGRYPIVGTGSRGNPIVDFGRPVGVDGRTGRTVTQGQIHYGGNGAHIVPHARN